MDLIAQRKNSITSEIGYTRNRYRFLIVDVMRELKIELQPIWEKRVIAMKIRL